MPSLQDQLMKAGLVDKKQVKKAQKDKRKRDKVQHKSNTVVEDEAKLRARQVQEEKAEKDRALNAQRDAQALQKAVQAQIRQLVERNKASRTGGKGRDDIAYNFAHGSKIKKIYVSAFVQEQLVNGRLAIVCLDEVYELVPSAVAEKIAQRDDSVIVSQNARTTEEAMDEDDPYAEYEIPDDLMW